MTTATDTFEPKLTNEAVQTLFDSKTAGDIMTPNPISINEDDPIQDTIVVLTDNRISALPVVDRAGNPVGVISQSDMLNYDRKMMDSLAPVVDYYQNADLDLRAGDLSLKNMQFNDMGITRVSDVMTPYVCSVTKSTSATKVAKEMLMYRVHRLFVVDENGKLCGVISTLDLIHHLLPIENEKEE